MVCQIHVKSSDAIRAKKEAVPQHSLIILIENRYLRQKRPPHPAYSGRLRPFFSGCPASTTALMMLFDTRKPFSVRYQRVP